MYGLYDIFVVEWNSGKLEGGWKAQGFEIRNEEARENCNRHHSVSVERSRRKKNRPLCVRLYVFKRWKQQLLETEEIPGKRKLCFERSLLSHWTLHFGDVMNELFPLGLALCNQQFFPLKWPFLNTLLSRDSPSPTFSSALFQTRSGSKWESHREIPLFDL